MRAFFFVICFCVLFFFFYSLLSDSSQLFFSFDRLICVLCSYSIFFSPRWQIDLVCALCFMLNNNQSSRHTRSFYIHIDTFCIRRTYCCLVENGSIYLKRMIDNMARILIGITYGFQTIYAAYHSRIICSHNTTDIIHNYNNNSKTKKKTMHNQLAA